MTFNFQIRLLGVKLPLQIFSKLSNQQKGLRGEIEVARYLKQKGFKILVHRYRCRFGEIDLTVRDGNTLVFVEVKTRGSSDFGEPSLAVTSEKQKHISQVALDYLRRLSYPPIAFRFDIVEVVYSDHQIEFQHIQDAFPLSEPFIY